MNVIETFGLTKRYGAMSALAGINMRVPSGSMFGFLGPNGAGKTTAMRIFVGLLQPTGGRASLLGLNCWRDATRVARRVGYLSGDVRFYEWLTGGALLDFCDRARGGGHAREAGRLCERLDLRVDRRIGQFSRGMKQKLGLVVALMHRPEMLILDEPTTALDPLVREAIFDELRAVVREGRTVLFSSHSLAEVQALCDRVAIIRDGRIIEDSSMDVLRQRAVRRVEFRLREGAARPEEMVATPAEWTPVDGESSGSVQPSRMAGTWMGSTQTLLHWLSSIPVEDVTISPPGLEDLFAAYYREGPDGA